MGKPALYGVSELTPAIMRDNASQLHEIAGTLRSQRDRNFLLYVRDLFDEMAALKLARGEA